MSYSDFLKEFNQNARRQRLTRDERKDSINAAYEQYLNQNGTGYGSGGLATISPLDKGIGTIVLTAQPYNPNNTLPKGYLYCDGSTQYISEYPELFEVIGIHYGGSIQDGIFSLPTLIARIPIGVDPSNTLNHNLTQSGTYSGGAYNTIATENLPSHSHGAGSLATASDGAHTHDVTAGYNTGGTYKVWSQGVDNTHTILGAAQSAGAHTHTITGNTGSTGSSVQLSILNPVMAFVYLIKAR